MSNEKCTECGGNGRFMGIEGHFMYCTACGGNGMRENQLLTAEREAAQQKLYDDFEAKRLALIEARKVAGIKDAYGT